MHRATVAILSLSVAMTACQDDPPAAITPIPSAPTGATTTPVASASAAPQPAAEASATDAAAPDPAAVDAGTPIDAGSKPPRDAGAKPPKDAGAKATPPPDAGKLATAADAGAAPTSEPAPAIPPPAPGTANAVASDIDAIFGPAKTFTARFKQENTQKVSGVVKKSTGVLFVEKPSKISFRYDAPNKNRIVSDGAEIKVYVAEDNVMYVQPVSGTQYPGALAFIMGHGLLPSFDFTFQEPTPWTGGPVLIGAPRTPTTHYNKVFFYVDKPLLEKKDPNVIRRVLVLDAQGNKNRFDFEEASQPASIDAAEFVFSPPPGTDIKK